MENLVVRRKEFVIENEMKQGQYHVSYICSYKNKRFFVRVFKDQVSFNLCLEQYKKIEKFGIKIPKMLRKDKKSFAIVYELIDAENCAKTLSKQDIDEKTFDKLFEIHRMARFSKIDINYLPEKYKFYNGELYYMSYESFNQNQEKSLEDYGLFYWLYSTDAMNHLKDLGLPTDQGRIQPIPEIKKKIVLMAIMKW